MWIVFRDVATLFDHLDRYIVDIVSDDDILEYQKQLVVKAGGKPYEFHDVTFLQQFVTSADGFDYFVRKYKTWTSPSRS